MGCFRLPYSVLATDTEKGGQVVEARYLHGAIWFPGVVHTIHDDGSLCIHYDDGDTEDRVSLDAVRALPVAAWCATC